MREILFKPEIHKFQKFQQFAEEFKLGKRDLLFTNEYIYTPFMKELNIDFAGMVFQEKFGAGEPSEDMITAILAEVDKYDYDRVIAVGGGAIMDLCKLIGLKRNGNVRELFFKKVDVIKEKQIIAIPTTCGTGSEVTNIAVTILKEEHSDNTTKLGLVSDQLIPDYAVLIPELLTTLPYKFFASSAIDALIHAVESYLSPARATQTSELFGVKAMEMILKGFKDIAENGPEARLPHLENFVTASTYAGLAFLTAGCATVHAMSFPLGGTHHVPHGESNYLLFSKVLEKYYARNKDGKIKDFTNLIADILGCKEEDSLDELKKLLEIILPLKALRTYGMKEEEVETFADSVLANQQRLVINSYVELNRDLIVEIYRELY